MLLTYGLIVRKADFYLRARLLRPVLEPERVAEPAAPSTDSRKDGGDAARGGTAR